MEYKLAESQRALAIISLEGHPIVLTKNHVDDLNKDDNIESIMGMFELANLLDSVVRSVYGVDSLNFIQNRGKNAGQEINHYHLHIIPRKEGDKKLSLKIPVMPDEERTKLSVAIKTALSSFIL